MSLHMEVLALTLVVRDEEDILEANLAYHLAQGVDVILAIDHGSSDRTGEILDSYSRGGRVRWFTDAQRPHDQVRRVNQLLAIAADEHGADWVIHGDADEFWMPAAGSLRDVFAAVPRRYGYVQAQRNNFLPMPDDGRPFHQRMVVRERRSLNLRGTGLEPKVAQRPAAATAVSPGNHMLESPMLPLAPDVGAVEVLHFPMRTFDQFERKVIKTGVGYECLLDRTPVTGTDQLELLALHREGRLSDYYEGETLDPERIARGLEIGDLIEDRRLQAFLAAPPACVTSSLAARRLMRHRFTQAALESALASQRGRMRELSNQLDSTQRELEAASAALERSQESLTAIRGSRIMRYSAPLRRHYYRWRGI
jgi:hypothetical protein